MIYLHNLADVETYKNEFPSAPNITYSPCVVPAQITLGSIRINTAEFIKNKESYRMYIMDYVDLNEVYALSNFDIFEDRSTAGRSIDWSRYIHKRLNSGLFPQDVDFQVFEEFEDVLFSKKLGSQMCFPMYQNEFFILCGLGVIFSEDFYQNIFSGDMSISTQNVQNYLLELMQIGLDPYQHDKEYQSLHHKYVPDVNMRKANSHLGLAKLNAFLQTIASLRVLSALQ